METELRSVHLDPDERSQPWEPITGLNGAVALDFDYTDKMIYFTQVNIRVSTTMCHGTNNAMV